MRILWISNIVFPEAKRLLKGVKSNLKISGGWLVASAYSLVKIADVNLAVVSVSREIDELFYAQGESGIEFFLIPYGKGNLRYNEEYESYWKTILDTYKADIIHIHGTEYSQGLACMNVCGNTKVVLSIQGVMGEITKCFKGGLSQFDIIKSTTVYDIFRGESIMKQARISKIRADVEVDYLKQVKYVIGRTGFDKRNILKINPNVKYFSVNESLRDEFYQEPVWNYSRCTPHRIFFSQSIYPLKGLHILLKSLPSVLEKYPDTQVHVAGTNIAKADTLRDKLRITGYGNILNSLIRKNGLTNAVVFTGSLDAEGMKREYLNANVFVCSSSCENSSNSISEAQILGVPCIASIAGGNPDLVTHMETGWLYEFDNIKALSNLICDVFSGKATIDSCQVVQMARERHNKDKNTADLLNVYHEVIG